MCIRLNNTILKRSISLSRIVYYALLFVLISKCHSADNRKKGAIFKNVNLFDGYKYLENIDLVVKDSIIQFIGKNYPESDTSLFYIVNGEGKTIIPPLSNAHVHVWAPKNLNEALESGVFTLFDMHTTDELLLYLKQYKDSIKYATYYTSGPGATVPFGHGTQFKGFFPTINDTVSPKRFVSDRVKNGSDYIKILREPLMPTLSFSQTGQIINESHKFKKLCVAHVSLLDDALKLSQQGIDGFVHIWYDKLSSQAQWDSLSKSKIFIVPTLSVIKKVIEFIELNKIKVKHLEFQQVSEETRKAFLHGLPILAGTDSPNFNINYGSDLIKELLLLSECGIPNSEVLKSATTNINASFRLSDSGQLKNGAQANFILIDGNPLLTIHDLTKIKGIWRKGTKIR
jgi:imidazolonepropionase-like amidohydrolase